MQASLTWLSWPPVQAVPVRTVPVRTIRALAPVRRFRFRRFGPRLRFRAVPVRPVPVRVARAGVPRFTGSVRQRFGSQMPVLFASTLINMR